MGKITINTDSLKTARKYNRFKIADGSNIYRILPPFGEAEVHKNYPYRFWKIVWLTDPGSNKRRPFAINDDEAEHPVQEYLDALALHIKARKDELEVAGWNEAQIKEDLKPLYEVQWTLNVQCFYAYNAANKAGVVGLLELKSTAHKAMKKMMSAYITEYNMDPTSLLAETEDSGVWFDITKAGEGKQTEYNVVFSQIREKDANGRLAKFDDQTALAENIVANYDKLGYDLSTLYVRKSYAELRELLMFNLETICQGCPEAIMPGFEVSMPEVEEEQEQPEPEPVKVAPVVKTAPAKTAPAPVVRAAVAVKPAPVKVTPVVKSAPAKVAPAMKKPVNLNVGEPEVGTPTAETGPDDAFMAEAESLLQN